MTERFLSEKRKGEVERDPALGVHFVLSGSIRESPAHQRRDNPRRVRKIGFSNGSGKCMEPSVRGLDVFCASHISPWAEDEKNRLNPENGLCLSTTYAAAFDRHFISFDEHYRLIVSKEIKDHYTDAVEWSYFFDRKGKSCLDQPSFCRHSRCLKSVENYWRDNRVDGNLCATRKGA